MDPRTKTGSQENKISQDQDADFIPSGLTSRPESVFASPVPTSDPTEEPVFTFEKSTLLNTSQASSSSILTENASSAMSASFSSTATNTPKSASITAMPLPPVFGSSWKTPASANPIPFTIPNTPTTTKPSSAKAKFKAMKAENPEAFAVVQKAPVVTREAATTPANPYSATLQEKLTTLDSNPAKSIPLKTVMNARSLDTIPLETIYQYDTVLDTYFTEPQTKTLLPFKVETKKQGVTSGLIISSTDGSNKKYIKSFLDPKIAGKSSAIELFAYKFFESLGCGARVDAVHCNREIAFLVSSDIREKGQFFIGDEALEISQKAFDVDSLQYNASTAQSFKENLVALEIVAKIFNLGDVKKNKGNFGIVINANGELLPVLLDFHFDPMIDEHPLTPQGTAIEFDQMERRLHPSSSTPGGTVGLTATLRKKGLDRATYDNAVRKYPLLAVVAAIESCSQYCTDFCSQLTREDLRANFNLAELNVFARRVRQYYEQLSKLQTGDFIEFISSPSNVLSGLNTPQESRSRMLSQVSRGSADDNDEVVTARFEPRRTHLGVTGTDIRRSTDPIDNLLKKRSQSDNPNPTVVASRVGSEEDLSGQIISFSALSMRRDSAGKSPK